MRTSTEQGSFTEATAGVALGEKRLHGQTPGAGAVVNDHWAGLVIAWPPRLVAVTDTLYGVLPASAAAGVKVAVLLATLYAVEPDTGWLPGPVTDTTAEAGCTDWSNVALT